MDLHLDERIDTGTDGSGTAPEIRLASPEPLTLMPWEMKTLGPANVADFMREVKAEMGRMPREGRADRDLQSAAENRVMAVWQAEKSARGEMACALAIYADVHFNRDEDDED